MPFFDPKSDPLEQRAPASDGAVRLAEEPAWLDRLGVEKPMLRRLGTYWERLRGDRPMPRRDELEPWAIPDLLPDLWIWRVQEEPPAFYLRLAGDRINRLLGYWKRGAELGEVAPDHMQARLRDRYGRVAFGPAVLRATGCVLLGREHAVCVRAERLLLPLGRGSAAAEDILGITWYEELAHGGTADAPAGDGDRSLPLEQLDSPTGPRRTASEAFDRR